LDLFTMLAAILGGKVPTDRAIDGIGCTDQAFHAANYYI
jgi:hypothetical protein